ncbi:conserved protein of unknown function [Tenacibaculum sp. 190524A02b]|uniref:hypothetical protein n=1 Tax=Tenacibaculum vairaonense TaxID=3137860 RepID=UPI0032B16A6E
MRRYLIFIFLISFFNCFSQNYRLINKANAILNTEKPDFKKVQKLLKRAQRQDYGFCGNAKLSAFSKIAYLESKMAYLKSDYKRCIEILDSEEVWIKAKLSDSLKVLSLIKIHGKEKIKTMIEKKSKKLITRDSDYLYKKICLNLAEIKYNFCFNDQDESFDYKKVVTIREIIEKTNFNNLIFD